MRQPGCISPTMIGVGLAALLGLAVPAATFSKSDPEHAFPELKVYSATGSPLRLPVEDWEGARQRITGDPRWTPWFSDKRAAVDDWMAKRRDRVEWIAGWWHDFVSPRDGSFLTWTADEPGETTLSSPSDPKVALTPKLHAAWVFGFRSRHTEKLVEAATIYRLTGDRRYADWAAAELDFYATNYTRWPLQTLRSRARIMHQSLDEATTLIRLVNTARLVGEAVTPQRKRQWFDLLFKPDAELLEETLQRVHNIACWQRSAVAHVALLYDDAALWKRAVDGPFGIRRQVADGVTSDYLWFEQSMGYNSYVVSALLPLFRQAALAGRMEDLRHEMAVVENLMLAPTYIRFPTGQLPNPADATGRMPHAPDLAMLAGASFIFPTPQGLAEAAKQRSWSTLLDPPRAPAKLPALPAVVSRNLSSSRMVVLRQGGWQVYFHYGQLDASHAQSEALNYEVFHGSTDVSHDPGTVGYGSPLHREYYTRGLSHNVPLVDGEGQERWHPGTLLSFDADKGLVAAKQENYRRDVIAERELRIENGRLTDTVRLDVTGAKAAPRRLGLTFHLQGRVTLPAVFAADAGFAATHRPAAFRHWREPRTARFVDAVVLEAKVGELPLRIELRVPGEFTVTHGSAPDVPPRRREAIYAETLGTGAIFTMSIQPK